MAGSYVPNIDFLGASEKIGKNLAEHWQRAEDAELLKDPSFAAALGLKPAAPASPLPPEQNFFGRILKGENPFDQPKPAAPPATAVTPASAPPPGKTGGLTREQVSSYASYRNMGLPHSGATALVANLSGEAGENLDPNATNNSGTDRGGIINPRGAYGLPQLNGSRQEQLLNFARQQGADPADRDTQLKFVAWDIKNNYPDLWTQLNDPNSNPEANLQRVVADYERPKDVGGAVKQRSAYLGADYPQQPQPVRLAGPVPTPDTVPGVAVTPGAPAAPPAAGEPPTTPMGQRVPGTSIETIMRMLQSKNLAGLGKVLLEQKFKSGQLQVVDVPVNDASGNFQGTRKVFASPDGQMIPIGGIDTSKAKEGNQANWQVIGEDQFGRKQYGYPPARGSAATQPPQPAQASADTMNLHGPEFLATLDPQTATQVQAIVEGRAPYPTGMLLKTPYGQKLSQYVTQVDPTFESGNATARTKMQADLATGTLGKNNNALNTAIGHLGELADLADKLDNFKSGSLGPLTFGANWTRNAYRGASQSPDLTNFNAARDKVAEEFTRVYRGAGGAEADIKREIENLNAANSSEQLSGAIQTMANLALSKIQANEEQYRQTMGPMAPQRPMVSGKTQTILDRINGVPAGQEGQPAAPEQQGQRVPLPKGFSAAMIVDEARKTLKAGGNRAEIEGILKKHGIAPSNLDPKQ